MLKKTHALALTVATAGLLGFAAPMASAATMSFGSDDPEIVNVSNNQAPLQACGNDVNTNGAGSQVLAGGNAVVGSLMSPGAVTENKAVNNRGCRMDNNESNRNSSTLPGPRSARRVRTRMPSGSASSAGTAAWSRGCRSSRRC